MPYARYIIIACALAAVSCTETYTEIGNNRIEVRERVIIIDDVYSCININCPVDSKCDFRQTGHSV